MHSCNVTYAVLQMSESPCERIEAGFALTAPAWSSPQVISLGTGTKCLGAAQQQANKVQRSGLPPEAAAMLHQPQTSCSDVLEWHL